VAAYSLKLHVHADPLVAEALAALHSVLIAKELGLIGIILEGDALQVVIEINSAIHSLSRIGHFTYDIRSKLHSLRSFGHFTYDIRSKLHSLRSFHVLHVKMEANSAALAIAMAAAFHVRDSTWLEEAPPHVFDIVFRSLCAPNLMPFGSHIYKNGYLLKKKKVVILKC
jgi:hypothetical protein